MRTVSSPLGPRIGIDGVEQPSIPLYALPHERDDPQLGRLRPTRLRGSMPSVVRQQAVPELNLVQESPISLLREQCLSRVDLVWISEAEERYSVPGISTRP
jgi:hypothetical protein